MSNAFNAERLDRYWPAFLLGLLLLALWLHWPWPAPLWQHVDERAFILHPLGFWSGDLNPHFFNYPTLHFYLASVLYYLYYLLVSSEPLSSFIAYHYFVDGADLIGLVRGFNSALSALTGVVCALIGRRLYGLWGGLWAGVLFAVLPLAVRFAHLANVDVPQVLWSSLALYFAVRVVDTGRVSDALWAGACTGLAMATKYPGALSFVPVGLACGLRFGWLRGPMWWSGLLALGVFAVCSPYVLLDWSSAWESISAMGSEHVLDEAHGSEGSALWHHLRYNLRYGVGLLGLLGLLGGLVGRVRSYRDAEWVVLGGLLSWLLLLGVSSSVFMRYTLPLGPLVVLFWVRGLWLLGGRLGWYWLLGLALAAEPLYGSYQTRSLLAGEDTRVLAQRWIEENAPPGTYLVHLNHGAGRLKAINPGGIYIRQNYYLQYYNGSDLIGSYIHLAEREGLPPLYVSLNPRAGVDVAAASFAEAPSHGLLVDYRHPLSQPDNSTESTALAELGKWAIEFDPGRVADSVYDSVDWFFLPIGAFGDVERTGPHIRIGVMPVKLGKKPIPMGDFFAVLRDILLAQKNLKEGDQERALELYEAVWSVPFSLDDTLSPEFMYDVLANMGLGYSFREDFERAAQFWRAAIALKPEHVEVYHNLGAIYAKMERMEEAFAMWDKALALEPDRANTHYNMGNALYHQGAYQRAIAAWSRAVELDPQYYKIHYNIGNAYFKQKKLAQALAAYQRGREHDPDNSNIYYNIAQIYIEQDNAEQAIRYLRDSIERNVQDPEAYYQLGGLYHKAGKTREARLSFERFLQLRPNHPQAERIRQILPQIERP